ncbi:hypothetical protein A1019T_01849 [Psychrobacter pasteurii]|uniref:Uncharacterized protein n=1 Tax=Psychrobacter pasteurii TaxID=1945520 RepID=A0A1R4EHD9_9GAMM|nr:hypothetical protein [Psychrobacter pasteurii]SJM37864.1 hypothetical protein A1019T_01849 [Psychrobacter pasteurii]
MRFIKDNLVVFFAGLFTIIMLIVGALYACLHYSESNGIAEMGAFLAGIFAPIAWVWFLASYAIQSSELKLQRKELTLQRKALETQVEELKHSVQAQQGSELALKEQSEALKKQLEITLKQFEQYGSVLAGQHPKFILYDLPLLLFQCTRKGAFDDDSLYIEPDYPHDDRIERGDSKDMTQFEYCNVDLMFTLKNIGGNCSLKHIVILDRNSNEISVTANQKNDYFYINIQVDQSLYSNIINSDKVYDLLDSLFSNMQLKLFYSYGETSTSDIYLLSNNHDGYTFIKAQQ